MNARRVAVVVSIAALGLLPSGALAHGEQRPRGGGLGAARSRRQGAAPRDHHGTGATAPDAAAAAAAVTGTEGDVGQWGPVVDWPVVGVHVALLPNGKVLAYDSVGDNATETYPVHEPHAGDGLGSRRPARRRRSNVDTGFNIFCSGLAHLIDGSIFIAGGNKDAQLNGIVQTHALQPDDEHVEPRARTWPPGAGTRASRRCATARC